MRLSRRRFLQLGALGATMFPALARASQTAAALDAARKRVSDLAVAKKIAFPLKSPSLHVDKAARTLELRVGDVLLKTYGVALGLHPEGPKTVQGDYKTPEGKYYVCNRNEFSAFHLFLGLSYPNAVDAKAALDAKRIDAKTATAIEKAEKSKAVPPWQTSLGGAVGIHGGGTGMDWTWGCVALDNDDIDELWVSCADGTPVEIVPGVTDVLIP